MDVVSFLELDKPIDKISDYCISSIRKTALYSYVANKTNYGVRDLGYIFYTTARALKDGHMKGSCSIHEQTAIALNLYPFDINEGLKLLASNCRLDQVLRLHKLGDYAYYGVYKWKLLTLADV